MAEEKQIIYLPTATDNIIAISLYIESKGYPMTAQKFKKNLLILATLLLIFLKNILFVKNQNFSRRNTGMPFSKKTTSLFINRLKTKWLFTM